MRITTNQILSNYQTGLSNSAMKLEQDRNAVLSQRKFQNVSEDPAAAAKAFQLRKEFIQNEDHLNNVDTVISQFESAFGSAMQVSDILNQAKAQMIEGMNGSSSPETRQTLATSIKKMQESVVASANAKFGDNFIFGGQNIEHPPFKLTEGKLQFTTNGEDYLDVSSTDPDVQAQLKELASAETYVDLGFGLEFDGAANIIKNSAFNNSISGLDMLGFGLKDGTPTNIVDIMGQFATELEKNPPDYELLGTLNDQFIDSSSDMADFMTQLGTDAKFLETTKSRLSDTQLTLNEKIVAVENVNLAEAITSYSWSQFAYNQALKVGNSLLSQSFIDFMR